MGPMVRRRGAQHGKRLSAVKAWVATTLLFVSGFAVGLGGHQALTSDGGRRAFFAVVAVIGAVVLLGLGLELRREKPGEHVR
jgi:hypothetical protein